MINKKQIFIVGYIAVLLMVVATLLINFNHKETLNYTTVSTELDFTKNFQPIPTPIISQNDNKDRISKTEANASVH